ncbi:outer membrane beta-barrel family protein [Chitinophaga sp. Cy-1792]|uniref:outer membrane beta-barrel family protein n=1 Tax=Chitinophaga sp. Cy-1792 TaxID=2608339 RepID=UPI00141D90DA|nr:outer membrane beta-barrel family protein [Chitinophaga sp. Cy-1792]NIG54769.1 outer membrane beta-barrel protein [Chitinophaga sp. Cy-1792]
MKHIIYFLALFFLAFSSSAQQQLSLQGRILDSASHAPLPFAALQISKNSTNYQLTADENGNFRFMNLDSGTYQLSVNYMGYRPVSNQPVYLKAEVNMDFLLKQLVKTLNGVEVAASQPYISMQPDKIVVNLAQSPMNAGENAWEAMKKAPGVTAADGIKLRGKSVAVYINGKPSRLSGADLEAYLAAIPAATIENLELMPNPSAKYEANGAAIINLVLAKNKNLGTNGAVNLGAGTGNHFLYNGGVSLNHRTANTNIYGSYDYMNRNTDATTATTRFIDPQLLISDLQTQGSVLASHTYKIGIDQTINKTNSFGLIIRGNYRERNTDVRNNAVMTIQDSSSVMQHNSQAAYHTPAVNAYYKVLLGKRKNELSVNADYFSYRKTLQEDYRINYYDEHNVAYGQPALMKSNAPASNNVWAFSSDYSFLLKKFRMETGIKAVLTNTDNDQQWQQFDKTVWEKDSVRSNHFIYQENVYSAYLTAARTFKKWDLQAGLRMEHTASSGNSVTLHQINENSYTSLFPSFTAGYNMNEQQQYSFSYSRKIERFGLDIVNPFRIYQSQYQYYQGNPGIRPTFSDNLDVSWMYNAVWMVSASYGHYSDVLAEVFHKEAGTDVTISGYDNVSSADQLTTTISYSKGFLKDKLFTTTSITGLYAKYNAAASTNLDRATVGVMAYNSSILKVNKTMKVEVSTSYSAPFRFGSYSFSDIFNIGLGVSKTVLEKKGTVTLNVTDIFNTAKRRYDILSYDVHARQISSPETRFVKLTFNYRFGNQQVKSARNRNTAIDEVKQRMQD